MTIYLRIVQIGTLAPVMLSGQFVHTVLQMGRRIASEPLKCPKEMRLVVIIFIHIFLKAVGVGT